MILSATSASTWKVHVKDHDDDDDDDEDDDDDDEEDDDDDEEDKELARQILTSQSGRIH